MAEEIVKVITIDTRKSERSIKDLKDDIKALKKELENTTIGSKDFDLKLTQLGQLQKEYKAINEEIVASSKPVQKQMFELARFGENLAKSYSAINAAMGLLSDGNEDVQKALLKTSQMIQLIQGLSGFAPLLRDIPKVIDGFKGLFRWIDPVNQRISNIAAKIAGFDANKLNALNGSGGGTASAADTGGGVNNAPVPNTTQGQKGFNAAIVQTNNDIEKQRQKIAELLEQHKQECDALEDLVDKHSEQAKVYDTILAKQGDLMKMSERYKEIQKTAKAVQEGRLNLTNDQLRALAQEKQQIEATFKSLRSAVDAEQDFAEQIEIAGGNLKKTSAEIDVAKNSLDGLEKQLRKAKWAKAIQTALNAASWITIILVIVQAVAALWKWIKGIEIAASKQRKLNKEIAEGANAISSKGIVALKDLAKRYKEVGDTAEAKKKFLTEFKEEIQETGLAIRNVSEADEAFINNTDAYIQALKDRAKAQAIQSKAVELYQEYLDEVTKKENTRKGRQAAEDKKLAEDLAGVGIMSPEEAEAVGTTTKLGKKFQQMEKEIEETLDRLFEEMYELEEKSDPYFTEVEEGAADAAKATADAKADELATLLQFYNDAERLLTDAKERELLEVNEKYDEQIRLAEKYGKDLTVLEEARLKEIDDIHKKYYDQELADQKARAEEQLRLIDDQIKEIRAKAMYEATVRDKDKGSEDNWTYYNGGLHKYKSGSDIKADYASALSDNEWEYNSLKERLEKENVLLEKQLALEGLTAEKKMEIRQQVADNERELTKAEFEYAKKNYEAKQTMLQQYADSVVETFQVAGNLMGGFADLTSAIMEKQMKEDEAAGDANYTRARKTFEWNKKLKISEAVINTFSSAIAAYNSVAGTPIVGPILGPIAAAAAVASGVANVMTIKQQQFEGGSVSISGASVAPPPALSTPPIEYTRNLLGNKETDELNKPTKVYVLESDITDAQNRVKVTEDNASF